MNLTRADFINARVVYAPGKPDQGAILIGPAVITIDAHLGQGYLIAEGLVEALNSMKDDVK